MKKKITSILIGAAVVGAATLSTIVLRRRKK